MIFVFLFRNVKQHHLVSWLRVRDMTVLTVGGLVFSSDKRIGVTVTPNSNQRQDQIWQLEVTNVNGEDTGDYQCQVNTDQSHGIIVSLSVIGMFHVSYFITKLIS